MSQPSRPASDVRSAQRTASPVSLEDTIRELRARRDEAAQAKSQGVATAQGAEKPKEEQAAPNPFDGVFGCGAIFSFLKIKISLLFFNVKCAVEICMYK